VNMKQLSKVLAIAEHVDFGDQFALLAGELADAIHASQRWGDVPTDAMHVAALFKWQARRFDATWDQPALMECYEWLKMSVNILDLDEKYDEIFRVVNDKRNRGLNPIYKLDVQPTDSRFKLLEA
jgi:hypothetical protein